MPPTPADWTRALSLINSLTNFLANGQHDTLVIRQKVQEAREFVESHRADLPRFE